MKITVKRRQPMGNKELRAAKSSDWAFKSKARPKEAHTSRMSYQKLCENLRVERRNNEALREHTQMMLEAVTHVNRALSAWRIAACTFAVLFAGTLVALLYMLLRG